VSFPRYRAVTSELISAFSLQRLLVLRRFLALVSCTPLDSSRMRKLIVVAPHSYAFIVSPWAQIEAAYTDTTELSHAVGFFLFG